MRPGSPSVPLGPGTLAPGSPGNPAAPASPGGPCGPSGPMSPWSPTGPLLPSIPGAPVLQGREKIQYSQTLLYGHPLKRAVSRNSAKFRKLKNAR